MIFALLLAAASPEAVALGERLARAGTLAALLPIVSARETEEMLAEQPGLSAEEKAKFRAIAVEIAKAGTDRLMAAEGRAIAEALSVDDLRLLVAHAESAPARRFREAMPTVIAGTMAAAGTIDFKGETRARFCRETGKACPK